MVRTSLPRVGRRTALSVRFPIRHPTQVMTCAALLSVVCSAEVARAQRLPEAAARPAASAPTRKAAKAGPAVAEPPADSYKPLLAFETSGWRFQVPIRLAGRVEGVSSFPVDAKAHEFQSGLALSPLLRLGARVATVKPLWKRIMILGEYEQDLPTGTWTSGNPVAGEGMPNSESITTRLRKGYGLVALGRYLHLGGGFMTSHWGLGLVANDGEHGWEPGSADFTDPRGGDLVLRGFVGTGPLTDANITATVAIDKVRHDDVLLAGDKAHEYIASMLVGEGKPVHGGFFIVRRNQTTADGRTLDVTVVDPAAGATIDIAKAKLKIEAEGAVVSGSTTLAATPQTPVDNVKQLGGALRTALDFARAGGVVDLVYASGDQNIHDANLRGFHADPMFETGLLLFRYVQAAQTGRGYGTAADPQLVGAPPAGIERLPTRGGLTDAVVIFPRLWVRPVEHLETYGGVLFAIAPKKNVDPFNTDLAGGTPLNALGGDPGSYWGTEVDVGVRYRLYLHHTELSAGAEGGVFAPGSALRDAAGKNPPPVYGGRLLLGYRL